MFAVIVSGMISLLVVSCFILFAGLKQFIKDELGEQAMIVATIILAVCMLVASVAMVNC